MKNNTFEKGFYLILLTVGLIFLKSSLEKISKGEFILSLGEILTKVSKGVSYPWYKTFLEKTVIPNSQLFGNLIMYGELLSGIAITLGGLHLIFSEKKKGLGLLILILGLIGGLFLNINFWLGFGHTSPATDSLNLAMIFIEVIGIIVIAKQRN